jgi:CubicO group peptidase (beta-lactamase class C family)
MRIAVAFGRLRASQDLQRRSPLTNNLQEMARHRRRAPLSVRGSRLLASSAFVLSLSSAGICLAQDTARMDSVVRSYVNTGTFAGSVLVARGSDVIFSKGYGLANVEWNVPSTPDARFKVASITKQFTAAAILLLEERGRLKTDDRVKVHLPEAPPAWDGITIFHLLTHTAGFAGFQSPPADRQPPVESADGTVAGFVAALMARPLESAPGERFNYTNSGYFVLGHLIQKLTGESYESFLRANIFTPLGMKDSGFDTPAVVARRAGSYAVTPTGLVHASYASDRVMPNAAAGLYSTTEDLLRWQNALYGGKVVSKSSLEKMTTPFRSDYGLGLYIWMIDGRRAATHGGGAPPFANLTYVFERGISVVVLGNISPSPTPEIAGYLASLGHGDTVQLLSEKKALSLTPSILARYVGVYQLSNGQTMTVSVDGAQLAVQPTGGNALELLAESETRFFIRNVNLVVEFVRDPAGNVTEFVMLQGTRQERAKRVK